MRNALVCIARDEDHYIDEWMLYHFKLGFSEIYIYQNDWQYKGSLGGDARVKLLEMPGRNCQLRAYNDYLHTDISAGVDFTAFFDVDEFMCLRPGLSLDGFLSGFSDDMGVALNWKCFGDSGLSAPTDGNYSVVGRFTRCQSGFDRHIKTIVNMRHVSRRTLFRDNPHCLSVPKGWHHVRSADGATIVPGPFNSGVRDCPAWLNHYICKTRYEFERIKIGRGRIEWRSDDRRQRACFDKCWRVFNRNESEDFTARDFYLGTDAIGPKKKPGEALAARMPEDPNERGHAL